MASKLQRYAALAILVLAASSMARAEVESAIDARKVGYPDSYVTESPSTASAWIALVGLGLVCIGPLFLNAHRTHLD